MSSLAYTEPRKILRRKKFELTKNTVKEIGELCGNRDIQGIIEATTLVNSNPKIWKKINPEDPKCPEIDILLEKLKKEKDSLLAELPEISSNTLSAPLEKSIILLSESFSFKNGIRWASAEESSSEED